MAKRKRSAASQKSKVRSSNTAKKELLESIAAELHALPGVMVERNKWLPSLRNPKDEREIDVLLTVSPLGYPMQIAIECKNEARPMEAEDIGAFIDKLNQVGIPSRSSIYISANGYRSGAKTRAQEEGVILLTPSGLTADRLSTIVEEAFQSVIFLLPVVAEWSVRNNVHNDLYSQLSEQEVHTLYDENGKLAGLIPDLIWENWRYEGIPSSVVGEHLIELTVPKGWHQIIMNKKEPIEKATAKILVWAVVVSITGKVERHSLINALTRKVDRFRLKASFDTSKKEFPVTTFTTEEDLEKFLKQDRVLHIVSERKRLPRILTWLGYWPQSLKAITKTAKALQAFLRGEIPDPRPFDYQQIEGTNLATVWEVPFHNWPVIKRNAERKPFGE